MEMGVPSRQNPLRLLHTPHLWEVTGGPEIQTVPGLNCSQWSPLKEPAQSCHFTNPRRLAPWTEPLLSFAWTGAVAANWAGCFPLAFDLLLGSPRQPKGVVAALSLGHSQESPGLGSPCPHWPQTPSLPLAQPHWLQPPSLFPLPECFPAPPPPVVPTAPPLLSLVLGSSVTCS